MLCLREAAGKSFIDCEEGTRTNLPPNIGTTEFFLRAIDYLNVRAYFHTSDTIAGS